MVRVHCAPPVAEAGLTVSPTQTTLLETLKKVVSCASPGFIYFRAQEDMFCHSQVWHVAGSPQVWPVEQPSGGGSTFLGHPSGDSAAS